MAFLSLETPRAAIYPDPTKIINPKNGGVTPTLTGYLFSTRGFDGDLVSRAVPELPKRSWKKRVKFFQFRRRFLAG